MATSRTCSIWSQHPQLNEDNPQFVSIEEPRLGLDVFAGTVSDLLDEVAEDLVVVWNHYAKASDADLSPKALELKHRLLVPRPLEK